MGVSVDISQSGQDYLKAIYLELEGAAHCGELVSTAALAQRLGVSAPSATNMLKRLDSLGLVEHVPYKGATLTEAGRTVALEVVRHHRLLEAYLAQSLGMPWEDVHREAEVLEHVLSEDLEERISAFLGDPPADPHGHPIPSRDLEMPATASTPLWDAPDGGSVTVAAVSDAVPEALRYLGDLGIRPGAVVAVRGRGPLGGPLFVEVGDDGDGSVHALSKDVAESVWVS
jgi:DtxR family transcriptional regulator, Mn-dependent transcriptional regulator